MTTIDELAARLTAAGMALDALRPRLEAGAPWPLAERFDHAPEAAWGPPEILAHVDEMLRYWPGQIAVILAGPADEPVPFGRIATDPVRIGVIERDRQLPLPYLLDRIGHEIERVEQFLEALPPGAAERRGAHQIRGVLAMPEIVDRFLVSHIDEHVRQLDAVMAESEAGRRA